MAKPWILCGLLPVLAVALMGAAAADAPHDFADPIDLPAGAVLQIAVQHTGVRTTADVQTVNLKSGSRFKLQVTPTPDGYHVRQSAMQVDPQPGASAEQQKAISEATAAAGEVEYDADEFLSPLRITDWPGYTGRMAEASAALALITGADPATLEQLQKMTPEQGAAGLVEANFLALPQGMGLDLGKPVRDQDTVIDTAIGAPMIIDYSYDLTALDKATSKATITTREAFNPASAKAAATKQIAALSAQQPRGVSPSATALAALSLERTTECHYEMDLKTGLTTKADCSRTVRGIGADLRPLLTTDHWVITQALSAN
ncbi:MAG: hypothetical protein JWM33_1483 [Caulobacteraceae bacterium]|nr:hypothetical protein [Caulobacteraceae bacterium]